MFYGYQAIIIKNQTFCVVRVLRDQLFRFVHLDYMLSVHILDEIIDLPSLPFRVFVLDFPRERF